MADLINNDSRIKITPGVISAGNTEPTKSLRLGAESVADINNIINNPVMPSPTGGGFDPNTAFTYSLSMGWRCRVSKAAYMDNAYECGAFIRGIDRGNSNIMCFDT